MDKQSIEYKKKIFQVDVNLSIYSSSRSQAFHKIDVLENFAKFTGQHPCRGPLK